MSKEKDVNGSAFVNIIGDVIKKANEGIAAQEGDYEIDGILHCRMCHTPKQTNVEIVGIKMKIMQECAV